MATSKRDKKEIQVADALGVLREFVPPTYIETLAEDHGVGPGGIYSPFIVIWLMVYQAMHEGASLSAAVDELITGVTSRELQPCKRVRQKRISSHTGGYSQARNKLPREMAEDLLDYISSKLIRHEEPYFHGRRVILIDGTTVQLSHEDELLKTYPPAKNQHGKSYWPIMQIVLGIDLMAGFSLRPEIGAMYGNDAIGETTQAKALFARIPQKSIIVGDIAFGIFSVANQAIPCGHDILFRIKNDRAQRLVKNCLESDCDISLTWTPSRRDISHNADVCDSDAVSGRFISTTVIKEEEEVRLILFTTLDLPKEEVIELYRKRWCIETDIRSLKKSLNITMLRTRSVSMVIKELLMAVLTYNVVRKVMYLAARRFEQDPRRLSFKRVQNMVRLVGYQIAAADTQDEREDIFDRTLYAISTCKIPKRKKKRSYPRTVLHKTRRYPLREFQNA